MEKIFHIELDDYAKPSFVSFGKSYFGTMNDIEEFFSKFDEDDDTELLKAFREYKNGKKDVEIVVAYRKRKMLEKVKVYGCKEVVSGDFKWDHINIWGYPYSLRCDGLKSKHYWINSNNSFYRIIKAKFENLQMKNAIGNYTKINMIWGFPHIIEFEMYNTLMLIEKEFDTLDELNDDMINFNSINDMDFTSFCNDIFGDG